MPSPIGYKLENIEPSTDPAYVLSRQAQQAFWNQAGIVGLRVKRLSLARGLDKNGQPMAAVHRFTRIARRDDFNSVTAKHPYSPRGRARVTAPPLQATGTASRTYSLLRFDVLGEGVWFGWGFDASTGLDWGIVLARHARGFTQFFRYPQPGWGHVPSRDVIGLSEADTRRIAFEMQLWWGSNRQRWAPRGEGASEGRSKPLPPAKPNGLWWERSAPGLTPVTGHTGEVTMLPGEQLSRLRGRGDLFTKQVPPNLKPPPSAPIVPTPTAPTGPPLADKVKKIKKPQRSLVIAGPTAPVAPLAPMRALAPPPPTAPQPPMTAAESARFFTPKNNRIFGISATALKWIAAVIGLGIAASITESITSEDKE